MERSPPDRIRTGTLGENADYMFEYIFWVKMRDYERASGLRAKRPDKGAPPKQRGFAGKKISGL